MTDRVRLIALALLASFVAACGSAPIGRVVLLLPGKECGLGDPCQFDFGVLAAPVDHVFQIVNVGDLQANAISAHLTSSAGFALSEAPTDSLASGGLAELRVSASPIESAPVHASLVVSWTFSSDAPQSIDLDLSAAHVAGGHLVIGGRCGFGQVPVNQTSPPCKLTLENDGGDDVRIDNITVTPSIFRGVGVVPVPLIIAPTRSLSFPVTATPTAIGATTGSASFEVGGATTSVDLSVVGT